MALQSTQLTDPGNLSQQLNVGLGGDIVGQLGRDFARPDISAGGNAPGQEFATNPVTGVGAPVTTGPEGPPSAVPPTGALNTAIDQAPTGGNASDGQNANAGQLGSAGPPGFEKTAIESLLGLLAGEIAPGFGIARLGIQALTDPNFTLGNLLDNVSFGLLGTPQSPSGIPANVDINPAAYGLNSLSPGDVSAATAAGAQFGTLGGPTGSLTGDVTNTNPAPSSTLDTSTAADTAPGPTAGDTGFGTGTGGGGAGAGGDPGSGPNSGGPGPGTGGLY